MKITFCRLTRTECAIYVGGYLLPRGAEAGSLRSMGYAVTIPGSIVPWSKKSSDALV